MSDHVELRSDTFTKPTPEMRQAIANAEVGDDMVGEDPTVNALEARVAALFGKEAAVFACSGTQSNQMAVWSHCQPGDELWIESTGHIVDWEAGGPATLRGVSLRRVPGVGGMLDPDDLEKVPLRHSLHCPPPRLLCLENTTNMGGGRVYPLGQFAAVAAWGREHGMAVHLDGARLFNACAASGYTPRDLADEVDTISVCFSKGLGAPMGSMLVGPEDFIAKARRARKILGGAQRQTGVVAAAALYALDHHVDRLAEDHANATALGEALSDVDGVSIDAAAVESNMVFAKVDPRLGPAADFAEKLHAEGVRMYPVDRDGLRMVTHLDFHAGQIPRVVEAFRDVAAVSAGEPAVA